MEILRISLFSLVIFYAGINLGFHSYDKSHFNDRLWLDACFNMLNQNYTPEIKLSGIDNNDENNFFTILKQDNSKIHFANLDGSQDSPEMNFYFPQDSTEEDAGFDSTLITADSLFSDSLKADSLLTSDTTKIDWREIDSTNRLKYFKYHREDEPYVELKEKKKSKFFVEPSQQFKKRTITIDSTGQYVEIKETVAGQQTKILLRMKLEDYINMKLALREREDWESLVYAYELKNAKTDLSGLITSFTNIDIPLPKVGVLSIFGEPKISLKIGGAVQIHGAWRNETTEGVTASRLGNTRNEPDFKQQVQINVNGTIGDKLNISADWNTERTFEYENQLKIKYTGYEDEIIQSIEAGNVSMQTPSLIGGAEALFGVKALFKMGPFSLTTLASQKKGETKEVSVNSGSTSNEFTIRPYDYSDNHYFIDSVYADSTLFRQYFFDINHVYNPNLYVNEIEVWKSINVISPDKSKERFANCYIDLDPLLPGQVSYDSTLRAPLQNPTPGREETGRFLLLTEGTDYEIHRETGFISFKTAINDQDVIAVSFNRGPTPGETYGEFLSTSTDSVLVLKLVKPRNLQPGGNFATAWSLKLKNIYPTNSRNIKQEGFEFKINYEIVGQEPTDELNVGGNSIRLLQAFGLDQLGSGGNPNPDNVFDWRPGYTIFPETGEIIFPTLEPFGKNIPVAFDTLRYQSIYDTTKTAARQDKAPDKWVMVGKNTGEASSVYQLGFNVVENSVKVILNGRELTPNVDYVVDYNIGQLTIRNDAAVVPGADLKITYEQNDLFQLASKTLLGARGVFDFSEKTQLGFTVMNLNQQTLSDKVRIGEEPLSNSIYGVDFKTTQDLPFLTKALDNLISTREMSSLTLNGEYAYMSPDPNTKKSTIPEDNINSLAYIDDFEGVKRTIPIGISYTSWKDLSPPENLPLLPGLDRQQRMRYKAKSFWFNITPSDVVVDSIYGGRKQVARADQQITVLDYVFLPDTPGTYNNTDIAISQNELQNWGGMMKVLSSTANNLTEQNIEFMEFWIKLIDAPPDASLYIDLGLVSEDVIPKNDLNTEDKNYNDAIDEGEDAGLDGYFDDQERVQYNSTKADPSGDDFRFVQGETNTIFDYFNINGTEGNAVLTDVGLLPDTEDLNRNGSVDLVNSYYRYKIPLDTTESNPFRVGPAFTPAGWVLIRVPLKDTAGIQGSPSLSNVETIRMFVQGVNQPVHFRMTEFNLVGSQWQKLVQTDTVLTVSVVSVEEDDKYTSPPGVIRERDRTRPDEKILGNEQSLNLVINGLPENESREAVKYLFRPLDVFNYREMKLFIHGDENNGPGQLSQVDRVTGQYSSEVYFRFGTDTSNYYEYRQPVDSGWNSISIKFAELTAVKQGFPDTTGIIKVQVQGKPGHYYLVRGKPTLTSVKFLSVGVYNPANGFNTGPLSGEVWVNELRVVGADDSKGWAYSFSTQLKLADLMTVNFNMSERNPYFHKLAERFGNRIESKNWAVNTDLDILKLVPFNMRESNLRINFSHTESLGKPLYIPGTDIKVDEAANQLANLPPDSIRNQTPEQLKLETQTLSVSNSVSSSNIKLKIPTDLWYIKDTWNALSFGFNYNNSFNRSPTVVRSNNWVWNANIAYGFSFSPDNYFKPADIPVIGFLFGILNDYKDVKVYFSPQTFSANIAARRNRNSSRTRPRGEVPTSETVSRDFTATRGFNFGWKITDGGFLNLSWNYNASVNSSLANILTERNALGIEIERPEADIWNDILGGVGFGRDNQYQQNVDIRTSPKLPSLWDINRYFTLTAGYGVGYQWTYDLRQEELGRSAGNSNKFTAGMILRWKSLTEPLFGLNDKPEENENQNVKKDENDTTKVTGQVKESSLLRALNFLKLTVKAIFFDYDNFTLNFSHDNSLSKSGIESKGTGFGNFWGIIQSNSNGPSRAFQLGLSNDVGKRALRQGTNLNDVFTEKNNVDFKTSRPLWEGAKLDITWNVGWSMNKNTTLTADENGNVIITNVTSTGNLTRSFLSLPAGIPFTDNGIKKVNTLYNRNDPNPRRSLNNAFVEGFESLPFLSKLPVLKDVSKYIPRANWRITWDGLEKLFFFKSLAQRVSLDHAYTSSYTEGWRLTREGNKEVQTQRVDYGFSPLVGLNISFGEVFGGNLSSNVKFSSRTSYDLGVTTFNITETSSREIGITANYSKSGFDVPLFGIALKNDIEFLLSYTSSKNSTIRFEMDNFSETGIPQDGTTRTTIEPRIKYTISSKVTLSVFYKRSTVEPEGAARIPPTTTNEAGLDVNILIQ